MESTHICANIYANGRTMLNTSFSIRIHKVCHLEYCDCYCKSILCQQTFDLSDDSNQQKYIIKTNDKCFKVYVNYTNIDLQQQTALTNGEVGRHIYHVQSTNAKVTEPSK